MGDDTFRRRCASLSMQRDGARDSTPTRWPKPEQPERASTYTVPLLICVPRVWHNCGMPRVRLSTTVDADLLEGARMLSARPDSALMDEALAALLARHRSAEVDASYAVYDEHPLDEPDEWGDLASFRRAVTAS